ncbi:hypothetical protein NUW54_g9747 [Trametes sanguinea]|uniref:Uncharacterized protein n=1 Tax=Trametes sanguinea TaxID=158606 RepID=A0ACC1P496_9APHY|nr:hypothetical protein NUW54_g9747 [Trametes sanguinea]
MSRLASSTEKETVLSFPHRTAMPPRNGIWKLFEELKDAGGRSVKYLNDRTHNCAWCKACLDECVRVRHEQELLNVEKGELREARSTGELRKSFKNPGLAISAASWRNASLVTEDFSGVIPICGKRETMVAHIRRCPYSQGTIPAHSDIFQSRSRGNENATPGNSSLVIPAQAPGASPITVKFSSRGIPLSHLVPLTPSSAMAPSPSTPSSYSGSPLKRARTAPDLASGRSGPSGDQEEAAFANLQGLLQGPCATCPCHHWTAKRQAEFAADMCKLFAMCNIPWNAAENPQLEIFFEKWVPGAQVPSRRQLSGKHLQEAVKTVRSSTRAAVQGKYATGQSDGWKNIAKTSVITSMMTVDREVHLVRTHDMTGLPKTGQEHVEIIKKDMTLMRDVYGVCPIAWVTDDGPDGKGARNLLRTLIPSLITLVCWGHQTSLLAGDYLTLSDYKETVEASLDIIRWFNNHGSALDLFNQEQVLTYQARLQEQRLSGTAHRDYPLAALSTLSERPLALILPAKTRWTSNFQSASRLLTVSRALKTCVLRHKEVLVDIGRRSQTANAQETAKKVVSLVEDKSFWKRLERVETHLRPLAVATNILQARHTRMDHVLLTLANLYRIYNTEDIEPDVKDRMLSRLELRWKKGAGQDQDLFILAVFLNPYVRGYCFDREALPPAEVYTMATQAFKRFFGTVPNADFTDALVDYSQNVKEFADEAMGLADKERSAQDKGEDIDIVELWSRIDRSNDTLAVCLGRNGVVKLAIRLLSVVANSAGVECAFSDFGRTHTKGRNRLNAEVVHNTGMLRMAIRREHATAGRLPRRLKRKLEELQYTGCILIGRRPMGGCIRAATEMHLVYYFIE